MEHPLTTYIRTKTIHKHRLKDQTDYETVKVYQYELRKFLHGPREMWGLQLQRLKEMGEISFDMRDNFKVNNIKGPVNLRLLDLTRKRAKARVPLTPLHIYMRNELMHVELDVPQDSIPVYFRAFLDHKKKILDGKEKDMGIFFTVDAFANRVHTPVVNLKHDLRSKILFHGKPVVSLDVKQMQPTILAKILDRNIGSNPFSDAIFNGQDVYELLKENCQEVKTRDDAKKLLFKLIFGKPMNDIGKLIKGDTAWVDWINQYKSRIENKNPHNRETHTNLAWLLQYSEVQVMSGIWARLKSKGIPFLTIHDDILCLEDHKEDVFDIMDSELKKHFKNYKITTNHDLNT